MTRIVIGALLLLTPLLACAADAASVLVRTAPIRQQPLVFSLSGYGTVMPGPGGTVSIGLPRAGKIGRLDVVPGQVVRRGDMLFELITDPVAATGYVRAKSALELARSNFYRVSRLASQQLATRSQLAAANKVLLDAQSAVQAQRVLGTGVRRQHVRAPFGGIVSAVSATRGDRVAPGKVVLQLMRKEALRVSLPSGG